MEENELLAESSRLIDQMNACIIEMDEAKKKAQALIKAFIIAMQTREKSILELTNQNQELKAKPRNPETT